MGELLGLLGNLPELKEKPPKGCGAGAAMGAAGTVAARERGGWRGAAAGWWLGP